MHVKIIYIALLLPNAKLFLFQIATVVVYGYKLILLQML